MIKTPGYSGTPLAKKLGIKLGFVVRLIGQPDYYFDLFTDLPEDVLFESKKKGVKNLVHLNTMKFIKKTLQCFLLLLVICFVIYIWKFCP